MKNKNLKLIKIFLITSNKEELKKRLIKRDQNTDEEVEKRFKSFDSDIKHWNDYDFVIINKNLVATKTIRLIIAAIKDRDIVVRSEGNQNGISDADIISLLKKMQKQREESIQLYTKGKRMDLVQSEEDEIKIIKQFLPKQMNDDEIKNLVKEAIEINDANSIRDMGKVMSYLKGKYSTNMDFSKASKFLKETLI